MKIFGAILRTGYEAFKENTINSENKTYFSVMEACGKGIRSFLEKDPEFETIYQGSDIVKTIKEFSDSIKRAFK